MTQINIPNTYSTIYTDPAKQDCKQKEVSIEGVDGKQIQIEQVALNLMVVKSGIVGTVWVTIQYPGGLETKIAEWTETKTTYQAKTFASGVIIPAGLDVILRFYLTTSNKAYRSRMSGLNYTYSLVDVPIILEPDVPIVDTPGENTSVIYIKCVLESGASEQIEKIKKLLEGHEISIFVKN
ncbi:MAG: hypothetical protein WCX48_10135 [Bacteroidales bacterium]